MYTAIVIYDLQSIMNRMPVTASTDGYSTKFVQGSFDLCVILVGSSIPLDTINIATFGFVPNSFYEIFKVLD